MNKKYYKNVCSIPVHEKSEVVLDQLINFHLFNPDSAVVLHISANFKFKDSLINEDDFINKLSKFDYVYINPDRLPTKWGSIIHAHMSNFKYIETVIDFDYITFGASNELFIRSGLTDRLSHDYSGWFRNYQFDDAHDEDISNDMILEKLMKDLGIKKVIKGQIEGSYYSHKLFRKIYDILIRYKVGESLTDYPAEEYYLPTLALYLTNDYANKSFTRSYLSSKGVSIKNIKKLLNDSDYLAVKRVLRNYDNKARKYIRNKVGFYSNKVEEVISNEDYYYYGR